MSAEEAAEYVATPKGALESACWFWATNKLDKWADADDNLGLTKKINGGTIGLEDRERRYAAAKAILGGKAVPSAPKAAPAAAPKAAASTGARTLKKGMKGDDVARMQKVIGVTADGDFGFGTQTALKKWQKSNGLTADGVAGPATQAKLFG